MHAITDGRDTPPQSAAEHLARLQAALPPGGPIATVCGRYYAMDRDKRWERVAKAYDAMVEAQGARFARCAGGDRGRLCERADSTNSSRQRGSATIRACRTATACSASTSAPIACAKSWTRCSSRISPALRARAAVRLAAAVGMTLYSDELDAAHGGAVPAADR